MKLKIVNYMIHDKLEVVLDGLSIITGKNGSGKSAIFHAIDWLIFGGSNNFIKDGAVDCEVSIELDGNLISRKVTNGKYSVQLNEKNIANTKEPLESLGISLNMDFYSQFDSLYILSKGPKERADMLNNIFEISHVEELVSDVNTDILSHKRNIKNIEDDIIKTESKVSKLKGIKLDSSQLVSGMQSYELLSLYFNKNIPVIPKLIDNTETFDKINNLTRIIDFKEIKVPNQVTKMIDTSLVETLKEFLSIKDIEVPKQIIGIIDTSTVDTFKSYMIKCIESDRLVYEIDKLKTEVHEVIHELNGKSCPTCGHILEMEE